MEPLVKWYGGLDSNKTELIRSMIPGRFDHYYEPFLGGGALYFSMEGSTCYVNDKCKELMNIYRLVRKENRQFSTHFKMMCAAWLKMEAIYLRIIDKLEDIVERNRVGAYPDFMRLVNDVNELADQITYQDIFRHVIPDPQDFKMEKRHQVLQEILRMEKLIDLDDEDVKLNLLVALKESIYSFLTEVLNRTSVDAEVKAAALAFILNYSADVPFRKDECKEYRLPFGGRKYCNKMLREQVKMLGSTKLQRHFERTTFGNMNALDFLQKYEPTADDFVFLDPPDEVKKGPGAWDFSPEAHQKLASYLIEECDAKWLLMVKPNISSLPMYQSAHLRVRQIKGLDKVIIKNY